MKKFHKQLLLGVVALSTLSIAACGKSSVEPTSKEESTTTTLPEVDYGTLTIRDYELAFMQEVIITPAFSDEEYAEDLTYSFEGNNIKIEGSKITGLVPNTETTVTARGEHHETTFKVTVTYLEATLTNEFGAESKYAVSTPEVDNYLLHFTVDVPVYVSQYTRLASFAFNGSNNSWYNLEMGGDGRIHLFAHFNGIEKYWIFLGTKDELLENEAIHFTTEIFKQGQKTIFYFNDRAVCAFDEEEMAGYATLSSMEVTAAADREGAGNYVVNLSKIYYELENSENYQKYANPEIVAEDCVLENTTDGGETKHVYGDVSIVSKNILFETTVDVEQWDANATRPVAFAFNGSDNSWYNIEMNASGDLNLFGHFNGVEKYWIFLGNKNDLMVDGKIHFNVKILKKGQATWYFFNEKLVCWFAEEELTGYAKLSSFEVTATTNVWQEGSPYKVQLSKTSIVTDKDAKYAEYMEKAMPQAQTGVLTATDGAERRLDAVNTSLYKFVYSTDVIVNQDADGWFRPCAFAFNNSDNSWYNVETGTDGNMTLFARFNGVEKYWISLGTKAETTVDGVFKFHVDIVRNGAETAFYYNGVLKASFNASEMNGYAPLTTLNITSCANREGKAYSVEFANASIDPDISKFAN